MDDGDTGNVEPDIASAGQIISRVGVAAMMNGFQIATAMENVGNHDGGAFNPAGVEYRESCCVPSLRRHSERVSGSMNAEFSECRQGRTVGISGCRHEACPERKPDF